MISNLELIILIKGSLTNLGFTYIDLTRLPNKSLDGEDNSNYNEYISCSLLCMYNDRRYYLYTRNKRTYDLPQLSSVEFGKFVDNEFVSLVKEHIQDFSSIHSFIDVVVEKVHNKVRRDD